MHWGSLYCDYMCTQAFSLAYSSNLCFLHFVLSDGLVLFLSQASSHFSLSFSPPLLIGFGELFSRWLLTSGKIYGVWGNLFRARMCRECCFIAALSMKNINYCVCACSYWHIEVGYRYHEINMWWDDRRSLGRLSNSIHQNECFKYCMG